MLIPKMDSTLHACIMQQITRKDKGKVSLLVEKVRFLDDVLVNLRYSRDRNNSLDQKLKKIDVIVTYCFEIVLTMDIGTKWESNTGREPKNGKERSKLKQGQRNMVLPF